MKVPFVFLLLYTTDCLAFTPEYIGPHIMFGIHCKSGPIRLLWGIALVARPASEAATRLKKLKNTRPHFVASVENTSTYFTRGKPSCFNKHLQLLKQDPNFTYEKGVKAINEIVSDAQFAISMTKLLDHLGFIGVPISDLSLAFVINDYFFPQSMHISKAQWSEAVKLDPEKVHAESTSPSRTEQPTPLPREL